MGRVETLTKDGLARGIILKLHCTSLVTSAVSPHSTASDNYLTFFTTSFNTLAVAVGRNGVFHGTASEP